MLMQVHWLTPGGILTAPAAAASAFGVAEGMAAVSLVAMGAVASAVMALIFRRCLILLLNCTKKKWYFQPLKLSLLEIWLKQAEEVE